MEENKKSYAVPFAIVIAGFLIAGAVFFGPGKDAGISVEKNYDDNVKVENNQVFQITEDDDPTIGSPTAPVVLINFGDFRCKFCAKFQKDIKPKIMEKYVKTGKVRYVYRDLITMGENSMLAAGGANCAGQQGKYWEFADYLHSGKAGHGTIYTIDSLSEIASFLNLDTSLFKQCLESKEYIKEVQKDISDAKAAGATGTPTVFINGIRIIGVNPLNVYESIIEEELLKAKK